MTNLTATSARHPCACGPQVLKVTKPLEEGIEVQRNRSNFWREEVMFKAHLALTTTSTITTETTSPHDTIAFVTTIFNVQSPHRFITFALSHLFCD